MEVARLRGCTWTAGGSFDLLQDSMLATDALADVAEALGYSDTDTYNEATVCRPGEVRRRLAKL